MSYQSYISRMGPTNLSDLDGGPRKFIGNEYFSCQKQKHTTFTRQNNLTAQSRVQRHYASSQSIAKLQQQRYGPRQSMNKKNKEFNVSVIVQYLANINEAFERFQNQQLSAQTLQRLNKLRRLLEIVHKFTVQQKLSHTNMQILHQGVPQSQSNGQLIQHSFIRKDKHNAREGFMINKKSIEKSETSDMYRKISPHKAAKRQPLGDISQNFTNGSINNFQHEAGKVDFGTQCSSDDQDKTVAEKGQSKILMSETIYIEKDQDEQVCKKLIGLAVKSLNLSIHTLNLKSIQQSVHFTNCQCKKEVKLVNQTETKRSHENVGSFDQNENCCKNHYLKEKLGFAGSNDSLISPNYKNQQKIKQFPQIASRQQLYSQLTRLKRQIKHLSLNNDEEKENKSYINGSKIQTSHQQVKKRLFSQMQPKDKGKEQISKLQEIYKLTKGIYRDFEKNLVKCQL